jgi:hypothetical protein
MSDPCAEDKMTGALRFGCIVIVVLFLILGLVSCAVVRAL